MFEKGRPLTASERIIYQAHYQPSTLLVVRIIEGHVPFWLRNNMCAVVLGRRIYFRAGVYKPDTLAGIELLAHELTHVEQYLSGLTIVKYLWASRYGYRQNPYEVEAYAKGAYVRQQTLITTNINKQTQHAL